MAYSTDDDLIKVQKDILSIAGTDNAWDDQHDEAELQINRDIEMNWFVAAANVNGSDAKFDAALIEPTEQLLRLSVYKTLELIYLFVSQSKKDDPFIAKMELFKAKYDKELIDVITKGVEYDWSGDGQGETMNDNPYQNAMLLIN